MVGLELAASGDLYVQNKINQGKQIAAHVHPRRVVATEAARLPNAMWQVPDQAAASMTMIMTKEEALSPCNNCHDRQSYCVP
jgi:hypothetical protein